MANSLEKFKSQYPDGALIAELVSINEGQYIVRASVVRNAETLASGLAASVDVQIAEDRARERAIAALGIVVTPATASEQNGQSKAKNKAKSNGAAPASKKSAIAQGKPATNGATPEASQPTATIAVVPEPVAAVSSTQTSTVQPELSPLSEPQVEDVAMYSEADPLPDEEDLGPPIDAIDESAGAGEEAVAKPAKPSAATIALETFSTSANPVDLSDVIAQTDVELTRLGWTSEQGRTYLEQNYGKRSRQHLTDEELMTFLLHLEDQP